MNSPWGSMELDPCKICTENANTTGSTSELSNVRPTRADMLRIRSDQAKEVFLPARTNVPVGVLLSLRRGHLATGEPAITPNCPEFFENY
jgi:hypothetical protein